MKKQIILIGIFKVLSVTALFAQCSNEIKFVNQIKNESTYEIVQPKKTTTYEFVNTIKREPDAIRTQNTTTYELVNTFKTEPGAVKTSNTTNYEPVNTFEYTGNLKIHNKSDSTNTYMSVNRFYVEPKRS